MFINYGIQLNNIGIQLQNIGNEIQNMKIHNQHLYNQQTENIGKEIFNIGNLIINYGMQMTNIINNIQNCNNQSIEMYYQMNMQMMNQMNSKLENNNINTQIDANDNNIYFLCFKFNNGKKKYINVSNEITIEELLQKFVNENNLKIEDFFFIFNGSKLSLNDKTKIKDFPLGYGSMILAYEKKENSF